MSNNGSISASFKSDNETMTEYILERPSLIQNALIFNSAYNWTGSVEVIVNRDLTSKIS